MLGFVGLFCFLSLSCQSGNKDPKYYTNLRHTKNTALFTCADKQDVPATYRANKNNSEEWVVMSARDKDIKKLANDVCKKLHGQLAE